MEEPAATDGPAEDDRAGPENGDREAAGRHESANDEDPDDEIADTTDLLRLPQDLEDVLYTSHLFVPVKERLGWIRGSNLGYSTPIQGSETQHGNNQYNQNNRKRPMRMPEASALENKNPVGFLNEIRGMVEYVDLGQWGQHPNITYTVGANIDGIPYSGTSDNKKEAKRNCAIDILTRLYRITIPDTHRR